MTKRTVSLVLLLTFALGAFAQTTGKTFTRSFNADGNTRIRLDLPGIVDLKIWNSPTVRLEIAVSLPAANVSVLDQLATVGRYDLKAESTGQALTISAPNLNKVVRLKGEELRETVSYVVFVPKGLEVVLLSTQAVAGVQKK
ncbi:MAG: hypothetical protein IPH12_18205 [Saprospirales bacterium]|jgi:hypothetical protein|nr:hypothetical protein [Saprospirales bacterium]MBK8923679.1 hypothetical protein [Saprospirales bacterium]